jgi:hypothetical protein
LLEQFGFSTALGPLTQEAQAAQHQAAHEASQADGKAAPQLPKPGAGRLCTLATALVDLPCAGRRLVAQSVIPGILSGDQVRAQRSRAREEQDTRDDDSKPPHDNRTQRPVLRGMESAACFGRGSRFDAAA